MLDLPAYVHVKEAYSGNKHFYVETDEVVRLISRLNDEWYSANRLDGELVEVANNNIRPIIFPDLRHDELYFVVTITVHESTQPDELSFDKYTIIVVSSEVNNELLAGSILSEKGKRLGRVGNFPISSCVRLDLSQSALKNNVPTPSLTNDALYDIPPTEVTLSTSEVQSAEKVVWREPKDVITIEKNASKNSLPSYANSLFPFTGVNENELTFDAGVQIAVRRRINHEWLEGELDGKVGMFPITFVEFSENSERNTLSTPPMSDSASAIGFASVLFDFVGRESDELTVNSGDSLSVLEVINDEWVLCFDPTRSRKGIIPTSFLNIYMNEDDEDETIYPSQSAVFDNKSYPHEVLKKDESSSDHGHPQDGTNSFSCTSSHFSSCFLPGASSAASEVPISSRVASDNPFVSAWDPDISVSSTSSKPPARPPPPQFPKKSNAPPRPTIPPQRCSLSMNSTFPEMGRASEKSADSSNMQANKEKIVEELIMSELQYLNDLGIWEAEITQCSLLTADQKLILTSGIPQLKDLSKVLLAQLTDQQSKPPESQCYGYAFMQLRDIFLKTFGHHFRCVESMNRIIDGKNPELDTALNQCVIEMRKMGSSVFDIPTAIFRPIQRCLKYPLFISEIIKYTPISHIDHPKLLEASKQMGRLAVKMNESKRRKELTEKYRTNESETISKRLSKLNVHTVKKKGSRFKYRLTSQFGLVHMQRDPCFDSLVERLDLCERRICKLLHAVQVYKQLVITRSKRYIDLVNNNDKLTRNNETMICEVGGFCSILNHHSANIARIIDQRIVVEAKKLLRLPLTKIIQKRYDKLIDYELSKKNDKNPDDIRMKQCDFEALNNQLKSTLPKLIENLTLKTSSLVEQICNEDAQFVKSLSSAFINLSQKTRSGLRLQFIEFMDPYNRRLDTIRFIGQAVGCSAVKTKGTTNSQSLSMTNSVASSDPNLPLREPPDGKKSEPAKNAAENESRASLQRVILEKWPPSSIRTGLNWKDSEIVLGDVMVVLNKERNRWLCSNGLFTGFVPVKYLRLVPTSEAEVDSLGNYPLQGHSLDTVSSKTSCSRSLLSPDVVAKNAKDEPDLIDLDDNLLDLTSPTPLLTSSPDVQLFSSTQGTPVHRSPLLGIREANGTSSMQEPMNNASESMESLVSKSLFNDLFMLAKTTSSSQVHDLDKPETLPTIPSRPVPVILNTSANFVDYSNSLCYSPPTIPAVPPSRPLPPSITLNQRNVDEDSHSKALNQSNKRASLPIRVAPPPPPASTNSSTYALCALQNRSVSDTYEVVDDFAASGHHQLSVTKNSTVTVLRKCDDNGSSLWWLLSTESGQIGYVPASFLRRRS